MKKITLFSDESALGNPGFGGYGTILKYEGHEKQFQVRRFILQIIAWNF